MLLPGSTDPKKECNMIGFLIFLLLIGIVAGFLARSDRAWSRSDQLRN